MNKKCRTDEQRDEAEAKNALLRVPKKKRTMNQLIADLRKTKPEVGSLEWHQKRSFFNPGLYMRKPLGW